LISPFLIYTLFSSNYVKQISGFLPPLVPSGEGFKEVIREGVEPTAEKPS